MKTYHIIGAALFAAAIALPGAASAASAYASDKISVFSDPHVSANGIIGLLQPGENVQIDRCTASGAWCRVFAGHVTGWVPASYLIGAAAKNDATPLQSLTSPPVSEQNDANRIRSDSDRYW